MKKHNYSLYDVDIPQGNSKPLNCEDEAQWREMMMDYKVKKYIKKLNIFKRKHRYQENYKVKKYVKKPIPVQALQYKDKTILRWLEGAGFIDYLGRLVIETPEGYAVCEKGNYIIKGVTGEFYPIRKDIFLKTYEPVED